MPDTITDFTHLRSVLEEYGVALRNAYQDNLIDSDRIATGGLLNSVEVRVTGPDGGEWKVIFNLAEWWKYVEDDTKPHWAPRGALLGWIQAKPVLPRPNARGKLPTPEQLDFLIRRRIAGESPKGLPGGTEGSHDLERAEQSLQQAWMPRIAKALQQDLSEGLKLYIVESFREINPAPVEL